MANSSLTKNQRAGIAKMHPDVRARATAFFEASNRLGMGLKIDVANTFRTAAQQKALRSTIAGKAAKKSWHQFGFAVDVYSDSLATKPAANDPGWAAAHALAKEFGFKAGHIPGDFGHIEGSLGLKKGELKDTDGDGYPDLSPLQHKTVTQPGWTPPTPTARPSPPAATSALSAADQKLANAHIAYGASRAMNAQPLSMSPPNPGSIRGLNVPSALSRPSAPPSNFSVPDRPSPIGSAPVGQVTRAPLGPALARPSPPGNFAGGTTPAAAPSVRQAAGTPTAGYAPKAQAAGTPTAGYNTKAQPAGTPTAGYNVSMPSGISRPAAPSKAAIEGALSQAQGKIAADAKAYADFEAQRAQAFSSLPGPPTTVTHPPNPTVGIPAPVAAPPAIAAPPAQVLAPALVPRPPVNNLPVASIPAAPQARAYDVYSGLAETAMDNTNRNQIGTLPGGGTTVTNQYGATTGMTPGGYQTAVGSMPSIPGMSGPVASKIGGAAPTMAGGLAGGLLGGPLGALIGATLVKEIAKPGGLLSKQNNFNTDWFGNIVTNKAVGGLGFPDRPSAPAGARNVRGFDSASDRSHAYGISPGAAAAIDRGQGGLY